MALGGLFLKAVPENDDKKLDEAVFCTNIKEKQDYAISPDEIELPSKMSCYKHALCIVTGTLKVP